MQLESEHSELGAKVFSWRGEYKRRQPSPDYSLPCSPVPVPDFIPGLMPYLLAPLQ